MNMTDRELLELAAKAAGMTLGKERGEWIWWEAMHCFNAQGERGESKMWNALTDDGDALRLAVTLELDIGQMLTPGMVTCVGMDDVGGCVAADEELGTDPYAATRRAIVRAAAEIGRQM